MKALAWYDVMFGGGLLLLTSGLSLWSVPLGLAVLGVVLCAVGARGAVIARRSTPMMPATMPEPDAPHREDGHGLADEAV